MRKPAILAALTALAQPLAGRPARGRAREGDAMGRHRKGTRAVMRRLAALTACAVVAAAAALGLPAQARAAVSYPYRLVDPGTFGGPQSFRNLPAVPLTRQGGLLGTADT